MKDDIVAWLRLFRAHTAILEAPIAVMGAVLGLGSFWDPRVAMWALFGVVYHFAGYGMNSYVDWKKGFDKDDPYKQHHPLNTGRINRGNAKAGVALSMIGLILFAEVLTGFTLVGNLMILVMLISGVAYNYFGKYTRLKFIPISIVHTMVFVLPYFTYSSSLSDTAIFVILALFIHHVYQIMISGDIKDLKQDEASLLQDLGAEVKELANGSQIISVGMVVQVMSYLLVIIEVALVVTVVSVGGASIAHIFTLSLFAALTLYFADGVVKDGIYVRSKRIRAMSLKELTGIWMILTSIAPTVGVTAVFVSIGVSLAYFFPMSKVLWGNWLKPDV